MFLPGERIGGYWPVQLPYLPELTARDPSASRLLSGVALLMSYSTASTSPITIFRVKRIYDYLISHFLNAGNATRSLRCCKLLLLRRNSTGKINCAVSNRHFDASYCPIVDRLVYFEFQLFCRGRHIIRSS